MSCFKIIDKMVFLVKDDKRKKYIDFYSWLCKFFNHIRLRALFRNSGVLTYQKLCVRYSICSTSYTMSRKGKPHFLVSTNLSNENQNVNIYLENFQVSNSIDTTSYVSNFI